MKIACSCGHDHDHDHDHAAAACACGHDHDHDHSHDDSGCACGCGDEEAGIKRLTEVFIATPLLAVGLLLAGNYPQAGLLFQLAAAAIASWRILLSAGRNILRGRLFDEQLLMSVAFLGAMAIGEYAEGIAVMLLFQVGEYFQSRAVGRSRRSISALLSLRPDSINLRQNGVWVQAAPEMAQIGDLIMVQPGERVALDCIVREGSSLLDLSALTGESMPQRVEAGDSIPGGAVNLNGMITAEAKQIYARSTAARILDMVENARAHKAKSESFITVFARYYTPAVVAAALMLALLPPLLTQQPFAPWIYRALVLLVISCPCALVISVPLTFFAGIGSLARAGILIKGGNYVQALARAEIAVFDKTGTLTAGRFHVSELAPENISELELLRLAAIAEAVSPHPAALSIRNAWQELHGAPPPSPEMAEEIAGRGVRARFEGREILAGSAALLQSEQLPAADNGKSGLQVHIAVDGVYAGFIRVEDEIKPDAAAAIGALKQLGVGKTVMLSGDKQQTAAQVAGKLGIDEAHGELLPGDKLRELNRLLEQKGGGSLIYTGDGINDAPVLARADVGIAMGGLGADAAIEAADVVIMGDSPLKLAEGMRLSRHVMRLVRQNVALSLGIKAAVMLLGALGFADMWMAVFADVGVALLAVLNAIRPA